MGSKKNLMNFIRRFSKENPHSSSLVVDLRNHGQSSKHWPPFTVEACAKDVVFLCEKLAIKPKALLGHSFGGKVALVAARDLPSLEQVWMLDCPPGIVLKKNPLATAIGKTA